MITFSYSSQNTLPAVEPTSSRLSAYKHREKKKKQRRRVDVYLSQITTL